MQHLTNPPPKNFLPDFKKKNPKSRVILYTDAAKFSITDFSYYKLADNMLYITDNIWYDPEKVNDIGKQIEKTINDESAVPSSLIDKAKIKYSGIGAGLGSIIITLLSFSERLLKTASSYIDYMSK